MRRRGGPSLPLHRRRLRSRSMLTRSGEGFGREQLVWLQWFPLIPLGESRGIDVASYSDLSATSAIDSASYSHDGASLAIDGGSCANDAGLACGGWRIDRKRMATHVRSMPHRTQATPGSPGVVRASCADDGGSTCDRWRIVRKQRRARLQSMARRTQTPPGSPAIDRASCANGAGTVCDG
jgi:hypothetical protein